MNKILSYFLSAIVVISCKSSPPNNSTDKSLTYRATLETKYFLFTFPKDSFPFIYRDKLIKECNDALDYDLKLLKWDNFNDTIRVNYHNSRSDLWRYTNSKASGFADVFKSAIWLVRNEESQAPTKHEMMHLYLMQVKTKAQL